MAISDTGIGCKVDLVDWQCVEQTIFLVRSPYYFTVTAAGVEYKPQEVVSFVDGKSYWRLEAQLDMHNYFWLISWLPIWPPDYIIRDANGNPVVSNKYFECSIDILQSELVQVDAGGNITNVSAGFPAVLRDLGENTSVVEQRLMALGYNYTIAHDYAINVWYKLPFGKAAALPTPYPKGMIGGGFK
jgi:hypothetical protein